MSNGKYDAADLAHLNKRDRQMSSKSEYKRLNLTIPDVVKVIREHVLEEAIEAVTKCDFEWTQGDYMGGQETLIRLDDATQAIEQLKNK